MARVSEGNGKIMENVGLITFEYVNTVIRERPREIHKGQCGRVLIIAGSPGMAGAAVLAARGAMKSGAGLVKVAVPTDLFNIVQTAAPQATCIDVDDLLIAGESELKEILKVYGTIAAGPGLGVSEGGYMLLRHVMADYDGPLVLDADGLNTMCEYDAGLETIKKRSAPTVLTPHPGEADRLLEALGKDDVRTLGRHKAAETLTEELGAVVLLKGAGTLVTYGGEMHTNTTGNPGMATGGSGDVLTGVIAAIAASGVNAFDAARTGAFIHGMAGDIAEDRQGQWGMTSVDIEEALPAAFRKIVGK